jgi:hypothetical protein
VSDERLGERLLQLLDTAADRVVLVAPFVKRHVLERLLEHVSPRTEVVCVTRWRLEEIAGGVSDLDVWDVVARRSGARLLLCHELHAKYYRVAGRCLVGSANLTGAALGWSPRPNLELLIEMDAQDEQLRGWEVRLLANAVEVDAELYDAMRAALSAMLRESRQPPVTVAAPAGMALEVEAPRLCFADWLPATRQPEDIYAVYLGSLDRVSRASAESATYDLAVLDMPPGLGRTMFAATVATRLLQHPIFGAVDRFVAIPRRFGEVTALLGQYIGPRPAAELDGVWQTMMRWMLHFVSSRYTYTRPRHTEVFARTHGHRANKAG